MSKKDNVVQFEKIFERNVLKKRLHIKVNDKIFEVKRSDKVMMLAGSKISNLMSMIESLEVNEEEISNVIDITLKIGSNINDIITIMSGQELLDYIDEELEYTSKEKMDLAMTLYQMPQTIVEDGVSNKDEDSFQ